MIMQRIKSSIMAMIGSMTGRIFVLLAVGTTAAAMLSLTVAERIRCDQFDRLRLQSVVESAVDVAGSLDRAPAATKQMLMRGAIVGSHAAPTTWSIASDPFLVTAVSAQIPNARQLVAGRASALCRNMFQLGLGSPRLAAGLRDMPPFDCWYIRYVDRRGQVNAFVVDFPGIKFPRGSLLNSTFFLLFFLASGLLSIIVARWVARPVRNLEAAARSFAISLDPEILPERGPSEVKAALTTFNMMQRRVMEGFRQRTELLASISHDLQTPLTRLRLRLEKVRDVELRTRLIADLSATQQMVREGLDLARSSENTEDWSWVDLDSMLSSLAADADECGEHVFYRQACGITVRVKPGALSRCLGNLIDNAVKYAGSAELLCRIESGTVMLTVRDSGPGIPDDQLARMFEPFVRGSSADIAGTGIGLSIARAQAATFDTQILLANRDQGGVTAALVFGSSIGWKRGAVLPLSPPSDLSQAA